MSTLPMNQAQVSLRNALSLARAGQFLRDIISLTKPKIIVLLLISTACPMVLASAGSIDPKTLLYALIGGALVSGSASAMNCIWDKDIDALMERTKSRPLPAGRLSSTTAAVFSLAIGFSGLLLLALTLNPLSAALSLFGHCFYVLIYTVWLKRTTPQNIVIGGAAGAVPPLVGWAAATGAIELTSVLMFFIIFLWTPPHFWALALNKNADYQRAGVPMLPVVAGERLTHLQMLLYSLALIPVSHLLILSDSNLGWFSWLVLTALGLVFSWKCYELMRLGEEQPSSVEKKTKKAWDIFFFSIVYLAVFFIATVLDVTLV